VLVPQDAAPGSQVLLRRVSVAGCDVTLGEVPVRVIVGFNHEPSTNGRVYAAAQIGNIPALIEALDDGCSTQEVHHEVCVHARFAPITIKAFCNVF
jgi:hypothetical protein